MLFTSINESTVKCILLLESIKLLFIYVNAFFNFSKLISLDSFSSWAISMFIQEIVLFLRIVVDKIYHHLL